jgi:hypothetical protein
MVEVVTVEPSPRGGDGIIQGGRRPDPSGGILEARVQLRETGDPRARREDALLQGVVQIQECLRQRAGPHQGQVASDDIPELGQLVEPHRAERPGEGSFGRDPR